MGGRADCPASPDPTLPTLSARVRVSPHTDPPSSHRVNSCGGITGGTNSIAKSVNGTNGLEHDVVDRHGIPWVGIFVLFLLLSILILILLKKNKQKTTTTKTRKSTHFHCGEKRQ